MENREARMGFCGSIISVLELWGWGGWRERQEVEVGTPITFRR